MQNARWTARLTEKSVIGEVRPHRGVCRLTNMDSTSIACISSHFSQDVGAYVLELELAHEQDTTRCLEAISAQVDTDDITLIELGSGELIGNGILLH